MIKVLFVLIERSLKQVVHVDLVISEKGIEVIAAVFIEISHIEYL